MAVSQLGIDILLGAINLPSPEESASVVNNKGHLSLSLSSLFSIISLIVLDPTELTGIPFFLLGSSLLGLSEISGL